MSVLERLSLCVLHVCFAATLTVAQDLNEQLLTAARRGDATEARTLLDKGALVNAKTRYGATPLSYACDRGSVEVVKLLLERGADVNVKDTFYGATPIVWAATRNHAEVVRLLLQKGGSKETAMEIAASGGHTAVVKVTLEAGGFTPEALGKYLTAASRAKHSEVVELLKKAGAVAPAITEFKVDPSELKAYEGSFRNDQFELVFKVKENKLTAKPITGQEFSLTPTAQHTFGVADTPGMTLVFTLDGAKVTSVTLKQPNGERILKRTEVQ